MATLDNYSYLTLLELAKRTDPRGGTMAIAEILNQTNEVIQDMVWLEANDTFSHKTLRRLSLPSATWRKMNTGVGVGASRTYETVETIGMLEAYAEVDVELVNAASDPRAMRMQEAAAFIEGMGQTLAYTTFYGDSSTAPEAFTGLAPRLHSKSQQNVISQGHTHATGNTSVYIVGWGPTQTHMIYPRHSKTMGINHNDLGEVTVFSGSSLHGNSGLSMFQAYRDHFTMKAGLCVRDERYIARLANVDFSGTTASMQLDEDNLLILLNYMPKRGNGAVLYMNRELMSAFDILAKDKNNVNYAPGAPFGSHQVSFRGNMIRLCFQISSTEKVVPT